MAKCLLITRPEHDEVTLYLSKWSKHIIDEAQNKSFDVIDLHRTKANKERMIGTLEKRLVSLAVINGHGSSDAVAGHDNEILANDQNKSSLKGTVVYARSCQSAKKLGPAAVKAGAFAYLGYQEDFYFFTEPEKMSRPLEDKTAELFLAPSNYVALGLLKGHSAEDANNRSKAKFRKTMEQIFIAGTNSTNYYTLRFLYWDMINQVCLGDGKAKV